MSVECINKSTVIANCGDNKILNYIVNIYPYMVLKLIKTNIDNEIYITYFIRILFRSDKILKVHIKQNNS